MGFDGLRRRLMELVALIALAHASVALGATEVPPAGPAPAVEPAAAPVDPAAALDANRDIQRLLVRHQRAFARDARLLAKRLNRNPDWIADALRDPTFQEAARSGLAAYRMRTRAGQGLTIGGSIIALLGVGIGAIVVRISEPETKDDGSRVWGESNWRTRRVGVGLICAGAIVGTALLIPGVVLLVRPSTAEKELEALRDRTDLVPTGREGAFGARYRIVSDAPATTMFDVVHLTF